MASGLSRTRSRRGSRPRDRDDPPWDREGSLQRAEAEWRGVAQAQFEALWAEWQRSATGIQHALHGISQLTAAAGANYADTEQSIAASFGQIKRFTK